MSETATTLIKDALKVIGVIAPGETPTHDEMNDGLRAMKMMLRHWSAKNMRLYFTSQDSVVLTGAQYYTIGVGGTINTARPASIRGGYVDGGSVVDVIDEAKYRRISMKTLTGPISYLWYSPEYPLGKIYVWPLGSGTLYIDSLKPLTDPSNIYSEITFPPEYDEAVKYNLALRLAPEYGRALTSEIASLALSALSDLETRNFAEKINSTTVDIIKLSNGSYNIDEG